MADWLLLTNEQSKRVDGKLNKRNLISYKDGEGELTGHDGGILQKVA